MSAVIVGIVFLLAGAGVYGFNTESHVRQIVFPGMGPDQTAGVLLGLGVVFVAIGALRWLRSGAFGDAPDDPFPGEGTEDP